LQFGIKSEDIIDASADSIQRMKEQCKGLELFEIVTVIKELSSLEAALKWSTHPGFFWKQHLSSFAKTGWTREMRVLERIRLLEKNVNDIWKGVAIPQNGSDGSAFSKGFRKCGFG